MEKHKTSHHRLAWRPIEVAETLGVSLAFIRKEIREKRIKVTKFGRAVRILNSNLEAYINSRDTSSH